MSNTAVESRKRIDGAGPSVAGFAFSQLAKRLDTALCEGCIELEDGGREVTFGDAHSDLHARVVVHKRSFYGSVLRGGVIGAAESYMDGDWSCSDLTALIRIVQRNEAALARLDGGWARLAALPRRVLHGIRRNTRGGSRRNIAAHYDLGNDFYRLFLDPTMTYSAGIFERADATMEEASVAKLDRMCRLLSLRPTDRVIEIGSGWGSFALHAARHYGCHITTTTISAEQYVLTRQRVADAGLEDRVTVLREDYRDLTGEYDKLVSIEMIEAVGYEYFDRYFQVCSGLLKPDGLMAIQAITTTDQRFDRGKKQVDFIKRYIFPGGCLPSVEAMCRSVRRGTDLRLIGLTDFAPHYAETLRRWRSAFEGRLDEVRALGYNERFLRMWEFYLRYCEAAFDEHYTGVVHAVFAKPRHVLTTAGG